MTPNQKNKKRVKEQSLPICSTLILVLNVTLFVFMWRAGQGDVSSIASLFGAKENSRILAGEWWRFVTPIFLHGSVEHLLVNGLSLYWFGFSIERLYGSRRYLLLYLFAGIISFIVSYWRSPVPSLGASGAIFGLVGAGLVFPLRYRDRIPEKARSRILSQLLTMAAINLGIGFTLKQVDNWAHLGGLAGGAIAALFLTPEILDDRPYERRRETLLNFAVVAATLLIAFCGVRQWNAPKLISITLHADNPWWHIEIPLEWRQETDGIRLPSGANLLLIDSVQASDKARLLLQALPRADTPQQALKVGSFPAVRVSQKEGDKIVDAYVISAYGESIALILASSEKAYPQAKLELERAVQGIQVRRAPQNSTP